MNNKSNNSGDCRNEIDEQASTIAALKEQVSTLQAAMGIQKQAIRALASQPAAPLAVSKDVEWLMQCAEEAKCDPDVATKIRAHCIAAAKREASQPAAPVQPQQPLIGVLLASKEQAQRAKMDERSAKRRQHAVASADFDLPAPNDMVDGHADRAQRPSSLAPTVAGSVDTPEFVALEAAYLKAIFSVTDDLNKRTGGLAQEARAALIAHINALIAPAAPSGESKPVARLQADISDRPFSRGETYFDVVILDRERCEDGALLYTHPAPSSPTAPGQRDSMVEGLRKLVQAYGPKSLQYDIEHPNDGLNSADPKEVERISRGIAAPVQQAQAVPDYELIQDDVIVAGTSGKNALREILHYASQYSQDGPVEIYEVTRRKIDTAQASANTPEGK